MDIIASSTPAHTAAEALNGIFQQQRETPLLLLLSGGSALLILEYIDVSLLGSHITITTLDERYSSDSASNTFAQISATDFFQRAIANGARIISTAIESDETLPEAGARFATALHHWRDNHPDGVMVATVGVGNDGHTAGIFPNQPGLDVETADWVVAYEVSPGVNPHPKRITITPSFLKNHIRYAVGLVIGEEKRNVLHALQKPDCSPAALPACILKEMQSVTIVTDLKE